MMFKKKKADPCEGMVECFHCAHIIFENSIGTTSVRKYASSTRKVWNNVYFCADDKPAFDFIEDNFISDGTGFGWEYAPKYFREVEVNYDGIDPV